MKAKQTRIELLSELGPFKAGSLINISPMVAANLIRQGKAKVSKDEPTEDEPVVDADLKDAYFPQPPIQDEPTDGQPKSKPRKKK